MLIYNSFTQHTYFLFDISKLVKVGSENRGDHYNLSFEFNYYDSKEKFWSIKGIRGCETIPVYGLEHSLGLNGKSISRVEVVELPPNSQLSLSLMILINTLNALMMKMKMTGNNYSSNRRGGGFE